MCNRPSSSATIIHHLQPSLIMCSHLSSCPTIRAASEIPSTNPNSASPICRPRGKQCERGHSHQASQNFAPDQPDSPDLPDQVSFLPIGTLPGTRAGGHDDVSSIQIPSKISNDFQIFQIISHIFKEINDFLIFSHIFQRILKMF